jgi:hypothetical protein
MVSIWLIYSGSQITSSVDYNSISIDWDEHDCERCNSLEDIKQYYDAINSVNSLWYFYKCMNVDDIVVLILDQRVVGIGKIISEYLDSQNPSNIHGDPIRYVEWFVIDDDYDMSDISSDLVSFDISIKKISKWNEKVKECIDKDPKYKEAFDALQLDSSFFSN